MADQDQGPVPEGEVVAAEKVDDPKPTHASSKDGTVKVEVASRLDLYEVMKPIGACL